MTLPTNDTYYTPRLGLTVHDMDDELDACRKNWDRLDNTMSGAIWVADGTTPDDTILFDGALIAERTSGKVWRAQKNASGVFEKKWIKFPWQLSAKSAYTTAFPSGIADRAWGYDTLYDSACINSSLSDIVTTQVKVPIDGYYKGAVTARWEPGFSSVGMRSIRAGFNNVPDTNSSETLKYPNTANGGGAICTTRFNEKFSAGDSICSFVWQSSGANIGFRNVIQIQLVRAL